MDIKKQTDYWIKTAGDDLETAEYLIVGNKRIQGLFFCHLTIEKAIKAHVLRGTQTLPPKSHSLSFLLEKTDLVLDDDQLNLCDTLMYYQLEGRYPENYPKAPTIDKTNEILTQTKNLFQWLKAKL
ncbi:MAG: hypothetical protein A2W91_14415 [Bacteroidetes bacterium GWF2_38_335]|nr:MAG: hypothetical protein A2W91_14415 [Bacteroidetes bacterium GWF2_38_335]OFY79405.1 MAG: hypothetical protein A2281_16740 [Bacteroidetes bacterium RIFOXYA12_FULL_38_20]